MLAGMRIIACSALVLTLVATKAGAQAVPSASPTPSPSSGNTPHASWGATFGASFSQFQTDGVRDPNGQIIAAFSTHADVYSSLFLQFPIGSIFSLEPRLGVGYRGADGGTVNFTFNEKLGYFDFGTLARVETPNAGIRPFFYAGPSFGVLGSCSFTVEGGGSTDCRDGFASTDVDVLLGGGIKFAGDTPITIELGYLIGLTNVDAQLGTIRNGSAILSVGGSKALP